MTLDDQLRRGAASTRRTATDHAATMTAPLPPSDAGRRSRLGPVVAATTLLVVVVGGLSVLRTDDEPLDPAGETLPAPEFTPVPDRPGSLRSESAAVEFWMPATDWVATTETLTPDIGGFEPIPAYEDADTILSVSTFDASAGSMAVDIPNCHATPVAALATLGPTDALVTIVETSAGSLPERRLATGIYEDEPERFYPYVGEVNEDFCLDRVRELGDADLFYREYVFTDAGRSFVVRVALGSDTTEARQRQAWLILDRLAFE